MQTKNTRTGTMLDGRTMDDGDPLSHPAIQLQVSPPPSAAKGRSSSNSSNSSSGSGSSFSSHASTVSVWRRQQQQQPRQQQQQQQRVTPSPESGLGAVDRTVGGGEADTTTAPTAIKTQHISDGGQETEAEEAPFLANGSTSTARKKRTPRGPPFQVQHQEPLLLPHLDTTQGAAGAAFQQEMGKLSKYIDPDRHVERGPYHGKSYPDSLTYEPEDSEVWRTHELQRVHREQSQFWTTGKKRAVKRWLLTALTGVLIGLLGVAMTYTTQRLVRFKLGTVTRLLQEEVAGTRLPGASFFSYLGLNLLYVLIANAAVWAEPVAAGSGIPEIKAFLNGVSLPRVVRVKTMLCKLVGVIFTVGSGLPAGKEGPMVHIGAVVAAGVSQGRSSLWGVDTSFSRMQDFRNDREKRDFVSCGAASGVASAFGAPLGGVLFSLEEGASYWSSKLTYRAFLCALLTAFTLLVIKTSEEAWGIPDATKMFSFGKFTSLKGVEGNYSVWELALFVLIGCLGGLLGAFFNRSNERLTRWRIRRLQPSPRRQCLEVVAVCAAMTFLSYFLPLCWVKCTPLPSSGAMATDGWTEQERALAMKLVPFRCKAGEEYNELASLFFTDPDTAIKQLFHFRESGSTHYPSFSAGALILYFFPFFGMAIWAYGSAVPSGLFVPTLLSGAALGRLFGHLLHVMDGANGTFADSGTYALVGAAAVLGGMARMTISLTVILLEATGDMQYVVPLMITLMAARWVGNLFGESLYDIHSRLKGYPVLEPDMPPAARKNMIAAEIMSASPKTFRRVERVSTIYDSLASTEHDCFPVLNAEDGNVLVGTVLRKALCVILQHKAFTHPDTFSPLSESSHREKGRLFSPLLDWPTLEKIYPRYPNIQDIRITAEDRQCVIDLRPVMNTAPYCINETASLVRTYRLFRTMGLRHLCVVNSHNQVTGLITRYDLLPDNLHIKYEHLSKAATAGERSYYTRDRRASAFTVKPPSNRSQWREDWAAREEIRGAGVEEGDEEEEVEDGGTMIRVL